MSDDSELVLGSLQRVAEITEDPAPAVYARLFARHPEMEQLFILDPAGAVRRNMLVVAIGCVMDHLEGRPSSMSMLISERINHSHLGVSTEIFDDFFAAIRDGFGDLLGADWTEQTHQAWTAVIASLTAASGFGLVSRG